MILDKNCKIWKATSNDELRESLQYVYFDGKDQLIATDGYIMAVIKVEPDENEKNPMLIDAELLKFSKPLSSICGIQILTLNGKTTVHRKHKSFSFNPPDNSIKFPNCKDILEKAKKLLGRQKKNKVVIGLNVHLLKNLFDALGQGYLDQIFLHFDKKELDKNGTHIGSIAVTTTKESENFGVIMPMRVTDEDF